MTLINLEAKVKIKRLCMNCINLDDSKREKIKNEVNSIYRSLVFSSDVEKNDFINFIEDIPELNMEKDDLEENKFHPTIDDEVEDIETGEDIEVEEKKDDTWNNWQKDPSVIIKPLNDERAKTQAVKDEMYRLKKQKETLLLFKKRKKLKEEVDKLEKEMQNDLKEESYLTEKKDKDGIIVLRKEKWETEMDLAKLENDSAMISLAEAEESGNEENIRSSKDRLKRSSERINHLRKVKFETKIGNFMTKFPRYINKGSGFIREISDGLGNIGGEYSKFETKSEKVSDMGFNEKSMFDHGNYFSNTNVKAKPKKSKKKKRKKQTKPKEQKENWSDFY